jgi:hypothetical protein
MFDREACAPGPAKHILVVGRCGKVLTLSPRPQASPRAKSVLRWTYHCAFPRFGLRPIVGGSRNWNCDHGACACTWAGHLLESMLAPRGLCHA